MYETLDPRQKLNHTNLNNKQSQRMERICWGFKGYQFYMAAVNLKSTLFSKIKHKPPEQTMPNLLRRLR